MIYNFLHFVNRQMTPRDRFSTPAMKVFRPPWLSPFLDSAGAEKPPGLNAGRRSSSFRFKGSAVRAVVERVFINNARWSTRIAAAEAKEKAGGGPRHYT